MSDGPGQAGKPKFKGSKRGRKMMIPGEAAF